MSIIMKQIFPIVLGIILMNGASYAAPCSTSVGNINTTKLQCSQIQKWQNKYEQHELEMNVIQAKLTTCISQLRIGSKIEEFYDLCGTIGYQVSRIITPHFEDIRFIIRSPAKMVIIYFNNGILSRIQE
jgi:hypothetical protein